MNISIFNTLISLLLGMLALFLFLKYFTSRTYSACDISVVVNDLDSTKTITLDYCTTSNEKIDRVNWTAKFTREALVRMVEIYPGLDLQRLNVSVKSAKFYNA